MPDRTRPSGERHLKKAKKIPTSRFTARAQLIYLQSSTSTTLAKTLRKQAAEPLAEQCYNLQPEIQPEAAKWQDLNLQLAREPDLQRTTTKSLAFGNVHTAVQPTARPEAQQFATPATKLPDTQKKALKGHINAAKKKRKRRKATGW